MAWHTEYDRDAESWKLHPGDHVRQEVTPLCERRMIVIPAVPSSGTSMVAGVLWHLGVHMGNVHSDKWTRLRGYEQFEDLDVTAFTWRVNGPLDHLVNQRIRFLDYLNYRFDTQKGQLGTKTLPTIWMNSNAVEQWPIDVLDVRRDLRVSVEKDIDRMATRQEREPGRNYYTAWEAMARYGAVASMHWAREGLLKFHPAKLTVEYDAFRDDPPAHIEAIVETFGLQPTDEQMTRALLSVRR